MNLFVEWSTRRKRRAATSAPPGFEPAKQDSLDHTARLANLKEGQPGKTVQNSTVSQGQAAGIYGPDDVVADLRAIFTGDAPARAAAAGRLAMARGADGPDGDDHQGWRAWMNSRYTLWRTRGYLRVEALALAWGAAECEWHKRHGAKPDPDHCAGCGDRVPAGTGMRMIDGAVVHIGDPEQVECPAIYGAQWRGAASAGLMAMGLLRGRP